MTYPYNMTSEQLIVFAPDAVCIRRDNPRFDEALQAFNAGDIETFKDLAKPIKAVGKRLQSLTHAGFEVIVTEDDITIGGDSLPPVIANKMIEWAGLGLPLTGWLRMLADAKHNTRPHSLEDLWRFIEVNNCPVRSDGLIGLVKNVYRGTEPNTWLAVRDRSLYRNGEWRFEPGADEDRGRTCSNGLHGAAPGYLPNYGYSDNTVTIRVWTSARYVAAVPHDYHYTKLRSDALLPDGELDRGALEQFWNSRHVEAPGDGVDDDYDAEDDGYNDGFADGEADALGDFGWSPELSRGGAYIDGYTDGYNNA